MLYQLQFAHFLASHQPLATSQHLHSLFVGNGMYVNFGQDCHTLVSAVRVEGGMWVFVDVIVGMKAGSHNTHCMFYAMHVETCVCTPSHL